MPYMGKKISLWASRMDMEDANIYGIDPPIKTKEIKDQDLHSWDFHLSRALHSHGNL